MKDISKLNKLTKEELVQIYLKKCEEFDQLESKFYKLQEEHNEALKRILLLIEKNTLNIKRLFGVKSEKTKEEKQEPINIAEKKTNHKSSGRKKGSTNFDIDYLETHVNETKYIEPEEIEQLRCDKNVISIGENISYKVFYKPASYSVTKIISKKYLDTKTNRFYQGLKTDPFPHSICTPELAVNFMVNKFMYGLPYYRQADVMFDKGLKISRQDICNFQIRATEILRPMYDYLKLNLLNNTAHVINADETTLKVIETGKSKCYAWVYCTSFYDYPIYIYEYCKTRSRENIIDFLQGYEGYLLTDGYEGYRNLNGIENAYCWVHARRKFYEILNTLSDELKKESVSKKIVNLIDLLFAKEASFKKKKYGPLKICEERNKKDYLDIVDSIFSILHNTVPEKNSALDRAFKYMLQRESGFKTFLKDGHIELSNNISERAIKPFVIDRKNFLFSNTENGAESSLIFFSLQQTARANNLNPVDYLIKLINILGTTNNISKELLDNLLPWKIKL